MKLLVRIEGEKREVSVTREGKKVVAEIDGRVYELVESRPEPGVYHFKHGNDVREFTVLPEKKGEFSVSGDSAAFDVSVSDPRKLGSASAAGAEADGVAEIRTQMPGKIVRVLVLEGDEVSTGDGVIVVEAMKMQNEMRSPKDGTVKKIAKSEGDTVNAGDVLVVIE
ncbi:MAG: acetyl-CoA carboxylase biotin carboxyl carrier protein subunit [Acidobacteriota bacterium]|nr:MAG: acetyl-CoA carboxylase biotin carboxyl carrier protein subunit [Acidobacteriota bacterium]